MEERRMRCVCVGRWDSLHRRFQIKVPRSIGLNNDKLFLRGWRYDLRKDKAQPGSAAAVYLLISIVPILTRSQSVIAMQLRGSKNLYSTPCRSFSSRSYSFSFTLSAIPIHLSSPLSLSIYTVFPSRSDFFSSPVLHHVNLCRGLKESHERPLDKCFVIYCVII